MKSSPSKTSEVTLVCYKESYSILACARTVAIEHLLTVGAGSKPLRLSSADEFVKLPGVL